MKIKSFLYILLLVLIFSSLQSYLANQRRTNRATRIAVIEKILAQIEVGNKANLFFTSRRDIVNKNYILYKVEKKTEDSQFKLLSKKFTEAKNLRKIPFGDLLLLDFDNEKIVSSDFIIGESMNDHQFLSWTLPPNLRSNWNRGLIQNLSFPRFKNMVISPSYNIKFILFSAFILFLGLMILEFFLARIKTRKLDFLVYAIAIVIGLRIIHFVEFGNSMFQNVVAFMLPIPISMSWTIRSLLFELLFISIPLFMFRFFSRKWKPNLDFEDIEFLKALILIFIGLVFILINVGFTNYIILTSQMEEGISGTRLGASAYRNPPHLSLIPLIALACANGFNNFFKRALASLKDSDTLKETENKIMETEAKLNSIQSSINPHFLYNALNSIATLAKTNPAKTEKMTLALSSFYKYTTNREDRAYSTIAEELDMINTYLEIEKIRFEDTLKFEIDIAPEMHAVEIPNFLLQPLVENAIKYGYNKSTGKIEIKISAHKIKDGIIIRVYDEGKPFDETLNKGYGLRSVTKKLSLLYPNKHNISFNNNPKNVEISLKH